MPLPGTSGTASQFQDQAVRFGALESDNSTASATAGAATVNDYVGSVTSETITTAAGATYTLTVTNSRVTVGDMVIGNIRNGTNTVGIPVLSSLAAGAGTIVAKIVNASITTALSGTIVTDFLVVKRSTNASV